ncbi:PAS domain-containing sensor histidine kinase [Brevibacillus thermoruber]|uniref:PAS domain-containing sensor histidine kinase n=1 Tax=Brevibacillus thermoruber TaxID=33942 RepID=UPI0018CDFF87|nr:PAS domain-containing sensor histidine kinase [Brevibacillus thermoruber]
MVLIIPTLVIYQLVVNYAKDLMRINIEQSNEIYAESIAKRLNSELNDVVLQLQLIAGQTGNQRVDEQAMYQRAKQTVSKSVFIQSIYYFDASKRLRFEAPFQTEGREIVYEYPKMEHVRWSYNYVVTELIRNHRGEQAVAVLIPVFFEDRRFRGALVAELSREYLSEMLKSISVTRGGFGYIVDRNGMVIASTDEAEWNKNYAEEPVVERVVKGEIGTGVMPHVGQVSVMTYYMMSHNWGLVVGVPESLAFVPVSKLSATLTGGFAVIFALMLCLVVLGMRHILNPIVRLTRFARHFHQSPSRAPFPEMLVESQDELGVLMRTIVSMAVKIHEKEQFLRDVIEGIPYALITLDQQGRITHVNRNMAALIGAPADTWKGQPISVLPPFSFLQSLVGETEVSLEDENKQTRIIRAVASPFNGGVLAVLEDVSQVKLLEAHVRQSERLALMGQITSGIAHELKNPLAVLASTSELLKEEMADLAPAQMIQTLVTDIEEEIKRMSEIVSEFLAFVRMRHEEVGEVEMDRLMDRVLHLLRIKLNEANVRVIRSYEPLLPPAKGRQNKLLQVFLNLLLNSVEAMPNGGTITIQMKRDGPWLTVSIADSGVGISEQDLQWLFNPFFSTKERGNGLGLTIARDIVVEHGGDIQIESVVNQGTTVRCRFPIAIKEGAAT